MTITTEILAAFLVGAVLGAAAFAALVALRGSRRKDAARANNHESSTALDEVRRESERLDAVLDAIGEGIALLDGDGTVVFCNPAFENLFRARRGAPIPPDTFPPDQRDEFFRVLANQRANRRVETLELRVATTPPRDIAITLKPYTDSQYAAAVILTAFDVTTRKRAEQVRTEFVANVSHELRTPLAAIRGYVETCLEPERDGADPPYRQFLPIIHRHAMRLNALIEDLLIISRIESRAMTLNVQPMQIHHCVENAIATVAPEAEKKRIHVVNALPAMLPDARADQSALERILINLIENAIKYSGDGAEVRISGEAQAHEVRVMVHDDGVGIPKEDQLRIFERFYRVDKARSRKEGGTGLGLSIVKHLVQSLGGEVWVDSEPGRGSTFCFTVPVAQASQRAEAGAPGG